MLLYRNWLRLLLYRAMWQVKINCLSQKMRDHVCKLFVQLPCIGAHKTSSMNSFADEEPTIDTVQKWEHLNLGREGIWGYAWSGWEKELRLYSTLYGLYLGQSIIQLTCFLERSWTYDHLFRERFLMTSVWRAWWVWTKSISELILAMHFKKNIFFSNTSAKNNYKLQCVIWARPVIGF